MTLRTPANLISLGRALLGPAIFLLLVAKSETALWGALAVAAIAGLSDLVDGYVARRRGSSEFGRYLDAACDALFDLGVFLGFLANHWIAASWFAAIYFAEIIVPYLGAFAKQLGHPIAVRWSARVKTIVHPLVQIFVIAFAAQGGAAETQSALSVMLLLAVALAASLAYLADHAILLGRIMARAEAETSA